LKIENYIIGTLAAEMPASFAMEALKAQAVCARTYAWRRLITEVNYPRGADLSDDINSCQAYISIDEFRRRHPQDTEFYLEKIKQAVFETRGEIMLYEGNPIDALYHSTCGGKTENAFDVYGQDVPYLRSVECEYCKESRYYKTVQVFSAQDINRIVPDTSSNHLNIEIIKRTKSGRTKQLKLGNSILTGAKFRTILNLPSCWWDFQIEDEKLIINSRGYGHGLGMCQYGAQGMAIKGEDYKKILKHYFHKIEIHKLDY